MLKIKEAASALFEPVGDRGSASVTLSKRFMSQGDRKRRVGTSVANMGFTSIRKLLWNAETRSRSGPGDAPERIRTSDLRFRRPTLYPAELRALGVQG